MNVRLDRRVVLLQPTEQTTELQEQVPGDPVRWRTWANARDVRGAEGVGLSGGPVEAQSSEVQRVYRIRQRRFGGDNIGPGWAVAENVEDFDPADFNLVDFGAEDREVIFEVRYVTRPKRRGDRYVDLNCERRQ